MKTLITIIMAVALACGLVFLASSCSPFAGPDIGETAVAMHAASFAPDNSTMAERQARFHQMRATFAARNPQYNPYPAAR